MLMTPEEKHEMLTNLKDIEEINAKKTDLMEEIVKTSQWLAQRNTELEAEIARLRGELNVVSMERDQLERMLVSAEQAISWDN